MIEHLKKLVKKELGRLLLEEKVITEEQLEKALDMQKEAGGFLGECLVKLGYAAEEDIVNCIMVQYGFPYLPLENYSINREVLKLIPEDTARKNLLIPVDKIGNILTLAMVNPLDINVVEEMEKLTGANIEIFITTSREISKALDDNYRKSNGEEKKDG